MRLRRQKFLNIFCWNQCGSPAAQIRRDRTGDRSLLPPTTLQLTQRRILAYLSVKIRALAPGLYLKNTFLTHLLSPKEPYEYLDAFRFHSRVALGRLGLLRLGFSEPRSRRSTRLNSSHSQISYAVFCLKKKKKKQHSQSVR